MIKFKQKGQAFDAFRLLIAFIITTAILAIIMIIINQTNQQSIIISTQKFEEGVISASKSPGTSTKIPFLIEEVRLKDTISLTKLEKITGFEKGCIGLVGGPGIDTDVPYGAKIEGKSIKMDVYVYCGFGSNNYPDNYFNQIITNPNCDTYCVIFLNKYPRELYDEN